VTTPIRQQFRPEDFADAQSAASKVDYSFQQVRTQLNTLGARQVVTLDFINNPANFPFNMPRLRLDNVVGFAVLACVNKGSPSVPQNTPEQVANVAWDKVVSPGPNGTQLVGYRLVSMTGLTVGDRYTLTLEAVGG